MLFFPYSYIKLEKGTLQPKHAWLGLCAPLASFSRVVAGDFFFCVISYGGKAKPTKSHDVFQQTHATPTPKKKEYGKPVKTMVCCKLSLMNQSIDRIILQPWTGDQTLVAST